MIHIADILRQYASALADGDNAPHPSHIATDLDVIAALWVTHLPSPNPINGSFIAMCACVGMTIRAGLALETSEQA